MDRNELNSVSIKSNVFGDLNVIVKTDSIENDKNYSNLLNEITIVLNKYSAENNSGTPDFILAQFLLNVLKSWDEGVRAREEWYGRLPKPLESVSS